MKLKNKKLKLTLIGLLTGAILVPAIVAPIAYTYASKNNKDNPYMFNGVKYKNYNDLISHVNKNTEQKEVIQNHEYKWSIGNSLSDKKYFNNSESLLKDSLSNIKTYDAYTSIKYNDINSNKGAFNEIDSKIVSQMELVDENSNKKIDSIDVFQGRNDSKFKTEEQAKKSYLSVHDIYNFNGINFRNKTDLEHYIDQQDTPSMSNQDYFTIRNPKKINGTSSLPISKSNLATIDITNENRFENDNYVTIRNFVRDNANTYVSIKKTNNQSGYYYYDINDSSNIANINTRVSEKDINYTKIESNQGKGTYVVDVSKDDSHNLNGPYLYDGGGNILSSNDKNQWKKISIDGPSQAKVSITPYVESFISTLLNEDENIPDNSNYYSNRDDMIFYFTEIKSSNDSLSGNSLNKQWFEIISFIKESYPKLYENVMNSYGKLKQTKRWSSFYKLPVLFRLIIQGLISEEANNDIIFAVKKFFTSLTLRVDRALDIVNTITLKDGFDILENKNSTKDKFSLTNIFGFNNNSYDLSTNIDAILNNIVEFYPNIILVMLTQNMALSNAYLGINTITPFIGKIKKNVKLFGINLDKQFENTNAINSIYYLFSSYDSKMVLNKFKTYIGKKFTIENISDAFFNLFFQNSFYKYNSTTYLKDILSNGFDISKYTLDQFESLFKIPFFNSKWLYNFIKNVSDLNIIDIYKTFIIDKIIEEVNFSKELIEKLGSLDEIMDYLSKNILDYKILFNKYTVLYFEKYSSLIFELQVMSTYISIRLGVTLFQSLIETIYKDTINIFYKLKNQLDKNKIFFKLLGVALDYASNAISIVSSILDIVDNPAFKALTKTLGVYGVAIDVALFVIKAFIPETTYYGYEFATGSDNTKFMWDGGKSSKIFYGLLEVDSVGIDKMQFIDPILIQQPYSSSFYYFNGTKYNDFDDLKRDAIDDFINNPNTLELSKDVKKVYGFEVPNSVSVNQNNLVGNSVEELTDKIILDIQNNDKQSIYYNSEIYQFSNGFSSDLNAIIKNEKNKILSEILPSKIVMLPNLDVNGFPIFNKKEYETSGNDGSLNEFILPGVYWNPLISSVETDKNYLNNKYIIINPNKKINGVEKSSKSKTEDEIISEITSTFMKSFNVNKKTVIKQDALNTNSFDSLSSKYQKYKVYQVNDTLLGTKYFLSESDALNYYYSINNMSMHQITKDEYIYIFNNMQFNSKDELYQYIKNNAVEVK